MKHRKKAEAPCSLLEFDNGAGPMLTASCYELSRQDLASISDVEMAFSTTRLLASEEAIPQEFKRGNAYTVLAESIFYGRPLPDCEMRFLPGFEDDAAPGDLNRCVRAHLASHSPRHEHKIAAVGLMIAAVCKLEPATPESFPVGDVGASSAG